ncbi:ABC transporter permease [Oryzibacter oryziterrae]|uniref:ABC transporter permease n=1 Tax=Oryzibacter oryziterrae TaxID=2766474 RepID=UPI001F2019D1|nr:ABC transporter permease subunit [Oryzibacter oryziterrae]
MVFHKVTPGGVGRRLVPNIFDVAALVLVTGLLVLIAYGVDQADAPLATLPTRTISLDPWLLPQYALRTTLRMLTAMVWSLVFTFVYATLAAKSRRAEMVLIPLLDVLQSVPILGFLTFTVVFFMGLFPGRVLGAELASVFAIFTSQAWNMTFSMYQSLRSLPKDLEEVSSSFHLSWWQRFWHLDVPFAMPGLVWNAMMSMSGGWFFVVASEAITVGDTSVVLPGIGSYVATAIDQQNLAAIGWAVLSMLVIIIAYDQLLFRPIVAWADKFRVEQTASGEAPDSWVLDLFRRTRALRAVTLFASNGLRAIGRLSLPLPRLPRPALRLALPEQLVDGAWRVILVVATVWIGSEIVRFVGANLGLSDVAEAFGKGLLTLLRVSVLIAIASLVWVPIGVWVGLRPRIAQKVQPLAQFLAAFPANIAFPAAVMLIVHAKLDPNIWLSPLMILGTQWYILFNVIAGTTAFPSDLKEAAASLHLKGWRWWKTVMLPGVFPYYVTGAITASGGSWNASIVAEAASWGNHSLTATGLGSYIAAATAAGDFPRVVLGIAVMSIFVTLTNRLVWRPLYGFAERRLRIS